MCRLHRGVGDRFLDVSIRQFNPGLIHSFLETSMAGSTVAASETDGDLSCRSGHSLGIVGISQVFTGIIVAPSFCASTIATYSAVGSSGLIWRIHTGISAVLSSFTLHLRLNYLFRKLTLHHFLGYHILGMLELGLCEPLELTAIPSNPNSFALSVNQLQQRPMPVFKVGIM